MSNVTERYALAAADHCLGVIVHALQHVDAVQTGVRDRREFYALPETRYLAQTRPEKPRRGDDCATLTEAYEKNECKKLRLQARIKSGRRKLRRQRDASFALEGRLSRPSVLLDYGVRLTPHTTQRLREFRVRRLEDLASALLDTGNSVVGAVERLEALP